MRFESNCIKLFDVIEEADHEFGSFYLKYIFLCIDKPLKVRDFKFFFGGGHLTIRHLHGTEVILAIYGVPGVE